MNIKLFLNNQSNKRAAIIVLCLLAIGMLLASAGSKSENKVNSAAVSASPEISESYIFTEEEEKLRSFLEKISGISDVSVYLTYTKDESKVYSVGVVCSGGNDPKMKMKIISLITSLYDISSNKVYVLAAK